MMPSRRYEASPSHRSRVTRRQSSAVLSSLHRSNHVKLNHHASLSNTTYLGVPRSSFEAQSLGERASPVREQPLREQRLSFERQTARGPTRSSLENRVRRGVRGSLESKFESEGPRLQRSTSGLGFDDSDKENYHPGW